MRYSAVELIFLEAFTSNQQSFFLTVTLPTTDSSVRSLYLSNNQLRGTIPENFARIGKGWLKQFYADGNKLRGRFPSGWDPIWYLTNIDVRDNQLTRIPSSVCSMNVFNRAEMVELRANCDICDCGRLCDNCD